MSQSNYQLHDRMGYQLSRASRSLQTRLEAGLSPLGLTRLKWCALSGIGLEGVSTPSELSEHIGITRPATSRLLRQMMEQGLVMQKNEPRDRRSKTLHLSEAGLHLLGQGRDVVDENNAHFRGKLTTAERQALAGLLAKLVTGEDRALDKI